MNSVFRKLVEEEVKPFNPEIMESLASKIVPYSKDYLDKVISASMVSLNKKVPLVYEGYRVLSPIEEFNVNMNPNKKFIFDFGRSDVFMIQLLFTFNGKDKIIKNLYIPFSNNGIMHISDTKYSIMPVLTDTIISPTSTNVFTRLLRDKVIFKRDNRNILLNGKIEISEVIYKELYRTQSRTITDNLGKVVTPSAAYLFAKKGVMATFEQYAGTKPILIKGDYDKQQFSEYDIYTTTGTKPWSLKNENYKPHNIKILILKEDSEKYITKSLIAGMLYILDVFPDLAEELVDIINSSLVNTEIDYWRIILSKIIFKNSYSMERGLNDIHNHFQSLEAYIDPIIKDKLEENEIYVNDFFDLIAYVMTNYNTMVTKHKEISTNISNRYLDILYYIEYETFEDFIKSIFELNKKVDRGITITTDIVNKIFNYNFSTRKIFNLNSKGGLNIALTLADAVGDNNMKIAQNLELQERGKGVNRGSNSTISSSLRTVSPSDMVLGSLFNIRKSAPTPLLSINPFIKIKRSGRVILDNIVSRKIELLERLLNGHIIAPKDKNKIENEINEEQSELKL